MTDPDANHRADYEDDVRPSPEAPAVDVRPSWRMPRRLRIALRVGGACAMSAAFLAVVVGVIRVREAANRMKGAGQLCQIGLAIHNYNDTYGELPKNTYSPDGRPLLSWRVHILPFLEEDRLYQQFNLDEPWDSPSNVRLLRL